MAGFGKQFEPLAAAVAAGSTIRAAAAVLGISERTAYRWASSPEFGARVNAIRTESVRLAVGRLAALAVQAVETLGTCLSSDDDAARIRAATVILDRFAKLSESCDLRERLELIEKRLEAK